MRAAVWSRYSFSVLSIITDKYSNFVTKNNSHPSKMNTETPILLLTGYLGSGKTTLVNHILSNQCGIKFAVIVNDIGEVNIDEALIQKGGVVNTKDDSLVPLQNGCICCTLKMDLVNQINDLMAMQQFDYIVIEASGICEPAPIASTICQMTSLGGMTGTPRLDCIATVVDAARMQDEFACGDALTKTGLEEDDIENLIIQQIEFCNIIVLNKVSDVQPSELERIKQIILALQPCAKIIETDYANVDLEELLNTHMFDFGRAAGSAGWIREIERVLDDDEDDDDDDEEEEHHHHHEHEHEHHHDHHHHHENEEEGEAEEYGISTFVWYRREPMDLLKFDRFVNLEWSRNIIRAKGICYFKQNTDMSYLFEQAGKQKKLQEAGLWYATAPEEELQQILQDDPAAMRDWDEKYGDRMQKIVFIGQKMNRKEIEQALDACLISW